MSKVTSGGALMLLVPSDFPHRETLQANGVYTIHQLLSLTNGQVDKMFTSTDDIITVKSAIRRIGNEQRDN